MACPCCGQLYGGRLWLGFRPMQRCYDSVSSSDQAQNGETSVKASLSTRWRFHNSLGFICPNFSSLMPQAQCASTTTPTGLVKHDQMCREDILEALSFAIVVASGPSVEISQGMVREASFEQSINCPPLLQQHFFSTCGCFNTMKAHGKLLAVGDCSM